MKERVLFRQINKQKERERERPTSSVASVRKNLTEQLSISRVYKSRRSPGGNKDRPRQRRVPRDAHSSIRDF